MPPLDPRLTTLLDAGLEADGPIVFLTGAGISAESGIPTFRGPEGYWTVGSRNYHPQEMATHATFTRMPEELWRWYLYRRSVCRGARPNDAHLALAALERALGDRFLLITQNVDGLHLRAGNSRERTYEIHGNIDYLRCDHHEPARIAPIPEAVGEGWTAESPFTDEARALLACCGGERLARPHVLFFDECYDEAKFRFESSLRAAAGAAALIVVGTSGSTNLPVQVGGVVARRGAPMIVVNPDESPFTAFAEESPSGYFARGTAGAFVPAIAAHLAGGA